MRESLFFEYLFIYCKQMYKQYSPLKQYFLASVTSNPLSVKRTLLSLLMLFYGNSWFWLGMYSSVY